ncbi:MAG: hypothetical protein PHQ43_01070 [Dehalococcoidales bacterium]|nr:hypothetical protein [Dehalococcoidales bacterium]
MDKIERCCLCDQPTGRAGRSEDSMYVTTDRAEIGPLCADCYFDLIKYGVDRADVIAVPIYDEGVIKPFDLAALEEWLEQLHSEHQAFNLVLTKIAELKGGK